MKPLLLSWRRTLVIAAAGFLMMLSNVGHAQPNPVPPIIPVMITQPTNGSTFIAPTNVQFDVSVYDPAEDVASVSFVAKPAGSGVLPDYVIYLGSVSNWVSLDPPTRIYTFDWSNALTGTWSIEAGAVRSDGTPVGSAAVQITVQNDYPFSVEIASPTNGAIFPGPTNIGLIANVMVSNDLVTNVEFFDGSQPIGDGAVVDMSPVGHIYLFDWTNQSLGSHVITATAMDTNGDTVSSDPVTIIVGSPTNPPPTVLITQPTNGSTFFTPINIQFVVSVDDPVEDVAFLSFTATPAGSGIGPPLIVLLGTVSNWTSLDPPTRFYMFDLTNAMLGTWSIEATAVRGDGTVAGSANVEITMQESYPLFVDIASPTNGAAFPEPTNIEMIAGVVATNDAAVSVEFFDGAHPLGVVSNWAVVDPPGSPGLPPGSHAYFFDWTNQSLGSHVLTATATDTNGNTVWSDPVTILVGSATNFPPIVRITSPPNRAVFRAPVDVPLLAYAQDPYGSMQSVEFFAGTNSLGFGQGLAFNPGGPMIPVPPTNPPSPILLTNTFELIWSNAPPGAYAITALATDDDGASATSAPVNITILPVPPPPTNLTGIVNIVATDPVAIAGTNCWAWLGGPLTWSNWVSPTAVWWWHTNCAPIDAIFTVSRYGSTNSDLTVNYDIGGTATNGVDYVTLPGSVTIPAGQSAAAITIVPIDGSASNISSTVILALQPTTNSPGNYVLGFPRRAEAIIVDNFGPQPEPGAAMLPGRSFHLWLTGPDGAWFHIDYTTNLVNWTPVCTNQVINGSIDFIDPDAATSSTREYRAVPVADPPSD
jgi:hypothetical protein